MSKEKNEKNYLVIPKHSLILRIVHWSNFVLLFMMIWSGLMIYSANRIYGVFPMFFYDLLGLRFHLAEGLSIHFTLGWLFVLNIFVYLNYLFFSGHYKELFPNLNSFKNLIPTILHDMGLRKTPVPQGKFNAAQQFAYTGTVFLLLIEILTGFGIYKPVQLYWLNYLFGGFKGARFLHFFIMILLCLFFFMHILQVIRAGWNNFRAMVAGYEIEEIKNIEGDGQDAVVNEVNVENVDAKKDGVDHE